jgi:hypothetical protein
VETRPGNKTTEAQRSCDTRYSERVDTIVDLFPIIPHEAAVGVDCCGCMVPRAKGDRIELVCNECGIQEGSLDGAILRAVLTSGIRHAVGGCDGDIVVNRFRGKQAELRCDKCGIVAGLVNPGIWVDLVPVAANRADRS